MLLNNKYIFSVIVLLLSFTAVSQKKQADKLYEKAQYFKAIPKYEKAIKTTDNVKKQESLIKLAQCYHILNEYKKSEDYYKQALALGKVNPEVNYEYGDILKNNNNYTEAIANYKIYLESKPDDKKAAYAIKSCQEIKYWQSNSNN